MGRMKQDRQTGEVVVLAPPALKITVLDSNQAAVDLCEQLLKNDPRSYYQIFKAMKEANDGYAPGVRTLSQLGTGLGPRLHFETLRKIAAFYGLTIVVDRPKRG